MDSTNSGAYWVSRLSDSDSKTLGTGNLGDETHYHNQTFTDNDNNITFNIKITNEGKAIFTFTINFSGNFNGNGKTITGMAAFDEDAAGLFGSVYGYLNRSSLTMKNCVAQSSGYADNFIAKQTFVPEFTNLGIDLIGIFFNYELNGVNYKLMIREDPNNEDKYLFMLTGNLNGGSSYAEEAINLDHFKYGDKIFSFNENKLDLRITIDDFTAENPEATFEFMYKTN